MRVLVSGGAGYIGSHTVVALAAAGHTPVIADNFSNSSPAVIPRLEDLVGGPLTVHTIDLTDAPATADLFAREQFDAVIHFAGSKAVGESEHIPLAYYRNNLDTTLSLLEAMTANDVHYLVFSSSATVYGEQAPVPYQEDYRPLGASSPYGRTKVVCEMILEDAAAADAQLHVAALRYFNPVGAHPSGTIGEDPQGVPNNLMPYISQVAVGRRDKLTVFGGDYPTDDGTCERDYIHVVDLANGHVAALEALVREQYSFRAWNLGGGSGASVLEVIAAFERSSGVEVPHVIGPRRPGDLPAYWADTQRAQQELGWMAQLDLDRMCTDTWRWQSNNPRGYDPSST